jgi:hypothetical protein
MLAVLTKGHAFDHHHTIGEMCAFTVQLESAFYFTGMGKTTSQPHFSLKKTGTCVPVIVYQGIGCDSEAAHRFH